MTLRILNLIIHIEFNKFALLCIERVEQFVMYGDAGSKKVPCSTFFRKGTLSKVPPENEVPF